MERGLDVVVEEEFRRRCDVCDWRRAVERRKWCLERP